MWLSRLWLDDFRSYHHLELDLAEGLTVVVGDNGTGKTNLIEAVGFALSLASFRHSGTDALVRHGAERAIVRAEVHVDARELLIEIEIPSGRGSTRVQLNRQRVQRNSQIAELGGVTVFSPDDLVMIKGGPGERRRVVDDAIVAVRPRHDDRRRRLRRIIDQRNALLRNARGTLTPEMEVTLDVWDGRLAEAGEWWANARRVFLAELRPHLTDAHGVISGALRDLDVTYEPAWLGEGLAASLAATRADDVRRGVTTVGPHRDEVELTLDALPVRTHASQGEQRSVALAYRLAVHRFATEINDTAPVLLLDDVFSELDASRGEALFAALPPGQVIVTTAIEPPAGAAADATITLDRGATTVDG